jgi:hypothetical protein
MESLPAPPPACQDRDVHLSRGNGRPAWRYAAALAGGLLVSVLAFKLATDGTRLDSGELTGTIAATNPARLELRLDQARGIIEVGGTTVAPTVQAHLVTRAPIAVIARVGGQEVQLGGFATDGTLSERHASFARGAGSPPTIVEIIVVDRSSGSVLRTAQLRVDATD